MERLPYFRLTDGNNRVRVETPFPFERVVVHWLREENRVRKVFCVGPEEFCRYCHMRINPLPRWNLIVREVNTDARFRLEIGQAIWCQINSFIDDRDYGLNFLEEWDLNIDKSSDEAITYSVRPVRRRDVGER